MGVCHSKDGAGAWSRTGWATARSGSEAVPGTSISLQLRVSTRHLGEAAKTLPPTLHPRTAGGHLWVDTHFGMAALLSMTPRAREFKKWTGWHL